MAYAVGEIILVIIGILLALQINNCNDDRKKREVNRLLLVQVLEETRLNYSEVIIDTNYRRNLDRNLGNFAAFLEDKRMDETDSLQFYLGEIFRTTAYGFPMNSLENYIQSNRDKNSELIRELVSLQSAQAALSAVSLKGTDIKFDYFYEPLTREVDFATLEIHDLEWISSLEFRNNIRIVQAVEEEISNAFEECLQQQKRTDSIIQAYLER